MARRQRATLEDFEAKGFEMKEGKLVKNSEQKEEKEPEKEPAKEVSVNDKPKYTNNQQTGVVKPKKRAKYRNVKVKQGDRVYDSKKEHEYALELDAKIQSGEVEYYEHQVPIKIVVNGEKITTYILDFQVAYSNGVTEYVDVKAKDRKTGNFLTTPEFKLKKKLIKALYGIEIKLV